MEPVPPTTDVHPDGSLRAISRFVPISDHLLWAQVATTQILPKYAHPHYSQIFRNKSILHVLGSLAKQNIHEWESKNVTQVLRGWNFNMKEIIIGLYQEYAEYNPKCARKKQVSKNLVNDLSLWEMSIPHPSLAGKCFTYK